MATEQYLLDVSLVAAQDLSSNQFYFVEVSTTASDNGGLLLCTSSTPNPLGVLQNAPLAGAAGEVRVLGISKVVVSSSGLIPGEFVISDSDAKGSSVLQSGDLILGRYWASPVDSGSSGQIGSILMTGAFTYTPAITT